jgi:AAA15 family ATPase/GTPase
MQHGHYYFKSYDHLFSFPDPIKKVIPIQHLVITFNKGVNIIVGENNAGKTAVIDAFGSV